MVKLRTKKTKKSQIYDFQIGSDEFFVITHTPLNGNGSLERLEILLINENNGICYDNVTKDKKGKFSSLYPNFVIPALARFEHYSTETRKIILDRLSTETRNFFERYYEQYKKC